MAAPATPAKEPLLKDPNPAGQGAPIISDSQYKIWLEELRPHLELACSLHRACVKAGIEDHYEICLIKYRLNDWFSKKVDAYRSLPGENVNEALTRRVNQLLNGIKREDVLSREELDLLKFFAEKHRTAQPFFVSRTETAEADPNQIGKILDDLEAPKSDYANLGSEIAKQGVEVDAPVQDQEQAGADSNLSA